MDVKDDSRRRNGNRKTDGNNFVTMENQRCDGQFTNKWSFEDVSLTIHEFNYFDLKCVEL